MPDFLIEPGLSIHYQEFNPGGSPAILFLHGLGANSDSWQLQIPDFTKSGYRIIAPDMRGFGRSSFPGGNLYPQILAEDMIRLMEHLRINNFHLVGISLGGTVALQMVLTSPDLVNSITITNSFAKLRPTKFSDWFFFGFRFLLAHLIGIETQAKYVARRLFPNPEQDLFRSEFEDQVSQSNPEAYRSVMRSLARFDVSADISRIETPTLVITGEGDRVVPPSNQAELARLIPGANQVVIENAGHAVTIEQPEKFNLECSRFMQSVENQK